MGLGLTYLQQRSSGDTGGTPGKGDWWATSLHIVNLENLAELPTCSPPPSTWSPTAPDLRDFTGPL